MPEGLLLGNDLDVVAPRVRHQLACVLRRDRRRRAARAAAATRTRTRARDTASTRSPCTRRACGSGASGSRASASARARRRRARRASASRASPRSRAPRMRTGAHRLGRVAAPTSGTEQPPSTSCLHRLRAVEQPRGARRDDVDAPAARVAFGRQHVALVDHRGVERRVRTAERVGSRRRIAAQQPDPDVRGRWRRRDGHAACAQSVAQLAGREAVLLVRAAVDRDSAPDAERREDRRLAWHGDERQLGARGRCLRDQRDGAAEQHGERGGERGGERANGHGGVIHESADEAGGRARPESAPVAARVSNARRAPAEAVIGNAKRPPRQCRGGRSRNRRLGTDPEPDIPKLSGRRSGDRLPSSSRRKDCG